MNCWTILNIEPTTDERQIRRAYAKILKTIDQDQEPERFIALRAALEQAQSWAAWHQADDEDDDPALDDASHASEPDRSNEQPAILLMQTPRVSMVWHPPQIEIEASTWQTQPTPEPPPLPPIEPLESPSPEPSWTTRVEEIRQRMWADEWNDQLLMDLRILLHDVQEQPLSLQMEAYESLSYPLAWADEEQDLTHFLLLFFQVFDATQLNDSKAAEHEQKLFARYQQIQAKQDFWQSIPQHYHPHLQALMTGDQQHIRLMWQLQHSKNPTIQKWLNTGMPLPEGHQPLATNLTYQTLIRMQWQFYLPVIAFVGWAGLMVSSHAPLSEEAQWLGALCLLFGLYSVVIMAYPHWVLIPAWGAWYGLAITMLGFVLFAGLPLLSESMQWWLSLGWLFGFLVWFGFLGTQHLHQWFEATKQVARNTFDWIVMAICWFALISMMVTVVNVLSLEPMSSDQHMIASVYGFLPLSALLYREAWVESFHHAIGSIDKVPMIGRVAMASISLALMGAALWMLESSFAALGLLGVMGFLLAFPSRFKAYLVKYMLYVLLIFWSFSSEFWLGVVLAVLAALYTASKDYRASPVASAGG